MIEGTDMNQIEKALSDYLGEMCGMRLKPHALTGLAKAAIAAMQPAPPQKQEGTDMNQIEKVARALCRADPEVRMGDADGVVEQRVNIEWVHYVDQAKAAIAAMPVPAEPVAWRYERTDGHFFLVPNRCRAGYPEADGWTETPLYAGPTPPAGGSDAE